MSGPHAGLCTPEPDPDQTLVDLAMTPTSYMALIAGAVRTSRFVIAAPERSKLALDALRLVSRLARRLLQDVCRPAWAKSLSKPNAAPS